MATSTHHVRTVMGVDNRRWISGIGQSTRAWGGLTSSMKSGAVAGGAAGVVFAGVNATIGAAANNLRMLARAAETAGRGVLSVGGTFEQSMANIRAVSQGTDEEMARVEQTARRLGATTSFSASKAADAMLVLAQSGLTVAEQVDSAEGVLKFAGATMGDMTSAAELATATQAAFNLEASETPRIVNALTRSTQVSKLNLDRLTAGWGDSAAAFGQFGGSVEEALASMGALVDVWGDGSRAGTSLRGIILRLVTESEKYADIIPKGTFETRGMVGVLEELEKRGVSADEVMGRLGQRAGPAMGILMGIGSDALREQTRAITGTNAAWEAYATTQATWQAAQTRVKSALEEIGISVFQTFGTDLRDAADNVAEQILRMRRPIAELAIESRRAFAEMVIHVKEFGAELGTLSESPLIAAIQHTIEQRTRGFGALADLAEKLGEGWKKVVGRPDFLQIPAIQRLIDDGIVSEAMIVEAATGGGMLGGAFGEQYKARLADQLAEVEEQFEESMRRLSLMSLEAPAPELPELKIKPLRPVVPEVLPPPVLALDEDSLAAMRTMEQQWDRQREAAFAATSAIRQGWMSTMGALTDSSLSATERIRSAFGGLVSAFAEAMQQMVAKALATQIELSGIFSGLGTVGLGFAGFGLGLIGNLLSSHSGSIVRGGFGAQRERLVRVQEGEAIIDRDTTSRNRGLIDELLGTGRAPRLSLAGGAGSGPMAFHSHVHVPAGSLLVADNAISMRQVAERLNAVTRNVVQRAYRE